MSTAGLLGDRTASAFGRGAEEASLSQDTDRDFFMGAEEAVEYGLVDAVVSKPQLIAATAK